MGFGDSREVVSFETRLKELYTEGYPALDQDDCETLTEEFPAWMEGISCSGYSRNDIESFLKSKLGRETLNNISLARVRWCFGEGYDGKIDSLGDVQPALSSLDTVPDDVLTKIDELLIEDGSDEHQEVSDLLDNLTAPNCVPFLKKVATDNSYMEHQRTAARKALGNISSLSAVKAVFEINRGRVRGHDNSDLDLAIENLARNKITFKDVYSAIEAEMNRGSFYEEQVEFLIAMNDSNKTDVSPLMEKWLLNVESGENYSTFKRAVSRAVAHISSTDTLEKIASSTGLLSEKRVAAIRMLSKLEDDPKLFNFLTMSGLIVDNDRTVCNEAIADLPVTVMPRLWYILEEIYYGGSLNASSKRLVIEKLGKTHFKGAISVLEEIILTERDQELFEATLKAIDNVAGRNFLTSFNNETVSRLVREVRYGSDTSRLLAINLLGRSDAGTDDTVSALIDVSRFGFGETRQAAWESLKMVLAKKFLKAAWNAVF